MLARRSLLALAVLTAVAATCELPVACAAKAAAEEGAAAAGGALPSNAREELAEVRMPPAFLIVYRLCLWGGDRRRKNMENEKKKADPPLEQKYRYFFVISENFEYNVRLERENIFDNAYANLHNFERTGIVTYVPLIANSQFIWICEPYLQKYLA